VAFSGTLAAVYTWTPYALNWPKTGLGPISASGLLVSGVWPARLALAGLGDPRLGCGRCGTG